MQSPVRASFSPGSGGGRQSTVEPASTPVTTGAPNRAPETPLNGMIGFRCGRCERFREGALGLTQLRRLVLAVFVFGVVGTGAELLLLGHMEDYRQLVPLTLFGLGLVLLGVLAVQGRRWCVRAFRALMMLYVVSGAIGIYFHIRSNVEFELEMYPSMSGWELVRESLTGALPALAPGTMVYLGLVGWASTMRHPLLANGRVTREENS